MKKKFKTRFGSETSKKYVRKTHSLAGRLFINQKCRANFKSPSAAFWQCNKSVCPLFYKNSFNVKDNWKKSLEIHRTRPGRCHRRSSGLNYFHPNRTKPIWLIIIRDHMCIHKFLFCIMMCTILCSVKTLIASIKNLQNIFCRIEENCSEICILIENNNMSLNHLSYTPCTVGIF